MDKRVKDTLLTLGIRSTYQGFHYIKHALCLCLDDGDKIQSICKYIYPEVARHLKIMSNIVCAPP